MLNSTYMAGLLFSTLFDKFNDPGVAVLAYHIGAGGTRSAIRAINKLSRFPTTLKEIRRFRSHTKLNCERMNYAYAFLGLRAVAQNLDRYELKIEPIPSDKFKERLMNKANPLR